jgi:hypothetical protein
LCVEALPALQSGAWRRGSKPHTGVDGDAAARESDDGVEVEFCDLGEVRRQQGQPVQQVDQRR